MTEGPHPWGSGAHPPPGWITRAEDQPQAPGPRFVDRVPPRQFTTGTSPEDVTTEALYAQLEELADTAPSAPAAWNLAGVLGRRAVPIDPQLLVPVGPELPIGDAALPYVLEQWFERPRLGVGLVLDDRHVALLTRPGARWGEFLNEHVRFTSRKNLADPDRDERWVELPDARPIGDPALVAWVPPGSAGHVRSTAVFRGSGPALRRQLAEIFAPSGADELTSAGWRIWSTAEPVKLSRRQVAAGMVALGPGQVIPWHVQRRDGWLLHQVKPGGLDHADWHMPRWLLDLLVKGKRPPKPPRELASTVDTSIW